MTRRLARHQLIVLALAALIAASSFVVAALPAEYTGTLGPAAPFNLGPAPVRAGWCASNPSFTGRLTASSSSTTAVSAITSPTVYGYISNVDAAWSCNIYYRYDSVTWNTGSSAGTYVWGALINSSSIACNWVSGTNDYLKANSTTDCPDTIAEYAMSLNLNPEGVYTANNNHTAFGHFGFAHSDCGTWYGNKVTKTGASFTTSATNNRPGSNCDPITLDNTGTSQTITYDATAPTGSVNINSGAAATNSTSVTLNLSASDGVSGVYQRRFSNDGSTWSAWEAYGTSKAWTLTSGDGTKTVYVRYRDNNLNVSATYSDTIVLDTAAPTSDFTTPNEGTTTIQKTTSYSVAWTENGTGSSIASRTLQRQKVAISTPSVCPESGWANDGSSTGGASPRNETGLANGYCYRWQLTITDAAGNASAVRTSGYVLVDTAAPTVDFTAPNEGTTTVQGTTSYTVSWTENGTGTTISTRSLQRQRVLVVTPGTCPATGWTNNGTNYTGVSPKNETGLENGYAYRWVQTLTDGATNSGTGTSGCVIVDTALPSAAYSIPLAGLSFQNTTSIDVTWTEDAAGGTITGRSLQMHSGAAPGDGTCDGVSWGTDGSATSATSPVAFSSLVTGTCYRWAQTLTKQGGTQATSWSGDVLVDTVDPTAIIAFPEDGRALAGTLDVTGTATDALSFESYVLEYGAGAVPSGWIGIEPDGPSVDDDVVAAWDTTGLQGVYTLRLTVTDLAGNDAEALHTVYLENSGRGDHAYHTRVPFDLGGGWRMAVGVANGELTLDRHLFEIPSYGPAQSLSLSYSSANDSAAGMFGTGWTSNLSQYLNFEDGFVVWHRADGGLVPFGQIDSAWVALAGHHESLAHDSGSSRYTVTLKDQTKLVFEDAGAGRLLRIENRFTKALTLAWTSSSATITDASGRHTDIVISSGNITSVTDSAGRGWAFGYTSGNLTSVTDPAGKVTTLAYSGSGLTSVERSRSRVAGSQETITWGVGYTSGRVTSVTDPVNAAASNTFNYLAATSTDPAATTVNLLKTYAPTYNSWEYTFDHLGRVIEVLDPEEYVTQYSFDDDSNLLELVLPIAEGVDQTISYTYDGRGNVLTQTTQLTETESVVTLMTYNSTNDLLIRSEANNAAALRLVTRYTYDGSGHLTSVNVNCTTSGTAPPADASTCTGAGTQDSGTNLITTFTYTANDQLETETDPRGIVTKHVYDTHGNEIETIAHFVAASPTTKTASQNVTTTFAFDSGTTAGKAGLPTSMTDPTMPTGNTTSYTYDSLGRQLTESLPGDASIPALTRWTTYDELGNVLTETDSWIRDSVSVERKTEHVYDKANRQTSTTDPVVVESTTAYDAAGNATSSSHGGVTTTRAYDGLGRVKCEVAAGSGDCEPSGGGSPTGSVTTHSYDGQGRDLTSVDPAGVTTTREYDLAGRLLSEAVAADEGELTTTYVYDLLGRQTSTTSPESIVTTMTYDRTGRVVETTEDEATTTHAYDRAGNATSTTDADGSVTTTSYDPLNRPTVVVANDVVSPSLPTEDVTTTTYYDATGRTVAFRDAQGIASRSIHNVRGLAVISIANCTDSGTSPSADPPACTGAGTHDATTNIISSYEYDGSGATIVVVIAQGISGVEATARSAYDGAGRRIASLDPLGTVSRTFYDSDGRVTKTIVNCTNDTSSPQPPSINWWTCAGTGVTDGTWNLTSERTYNGRGNLASETAPSGRKTTYVYDDADRLVERIDNDVTGSPSANEDLSTFYAYDAAGRQSAVRSPTANRTTFSVTRYLYNDAGQLVSEIRNCTDSGTTPPGDPSWKTCAGAGTHDADTNLVSAYEYDARGNRVAVIAPDPADDGTTTATVTTRYAFDASNRLCGVLQNATIALAGDPCATAPGTAGTPSENVWTSYAYDGAGNLATMVDGNGNTTTYGYDAGGRMTGLTDGLGNTTTWVYDALGRRTKQIKRSATPDPEDPDELLISWTYDAAGRVKTRVADGVTTTYGYDVLGNRVSAHNPDSLIETEHDRLGRPILVTVDGDTDATTTYTYSLTSPSWTDPSGPYSATLDKFDRQVSLTDPLSGTWAFTYRADGQPSLIGAPNGNTTTYAYDDSAMLEAKTTTSGSTERVEYSWSRNRAGQIVDEDYSLEGGTPVPAGYEYDSIGRLTAFTRDGAVTSYGWQAVPNRDSVQVASDPPAELDFDAANRINTSGYGHDTEGQMTARPGQVLTWDDLGRLTEVTEGSATLATYTYDALDRLLVVDRGSSDIIRFRYVGLTTQVAEIVDQDNADARIRAFANDWIGTRLFDWTGTGSNQRYYGTNGHHDVSWTADNSGAVIATLRYDPWGNLTSSTGISLPDHRFQGSWLDTTTDLYWVVARWYAPSLGRFVSEDSVLGDMEDPPSRHLYSYASGEPIGRWDPDGRRCIRLYGRFQKACSERETWSLANPRKLQGRLFVSIFIWAKRVCLDGTLFCFQWFEGDNRGFQAKPNKIDSRVWIEINYDTKTLTAQVNPSCGKLYLLGDSACHHAREIDRNGTLLTVANSVVVTEDKVTGVLDVRVTARDSAVIWSMATSAHITVAPSRAITIRRSAYPSLEMYYLSRAGTHKVLTKREHHVHDMLFPQQQTWRCSWPPAVGVLAPVFALPSKCTSR